MSRGTSNGELIAFLAVISLIAAGGYGWILNIIALMHSQTVTGLVILRAIGIFAAPLGAVLGYVG